MRQVNIRKLRKDLALELSSLPFEIIRNGVVIATIVGDEIKKGVVCEEFMEDKKKIIASFAGVKVSELRPADCFFHPMLKKGGK